MRILFICESFPTSTKIDVTGGVETRDWYVATKLAKNHQITVITNARQGTPATETIRSIKVIRVGQSVIPTEREQFPVRLRFIKACIDQIPKIDFELIQGSNILTQAIAAYMARKLKRPAVALIPDILIGNWIKNTNLTTGILGEILEPWVLHQPWNQIIAWSHTTKAKLISRGISPDKIQVIYGGVPLDQIAKINIEKRNIPTIVTAARLVTYKHVEIVIKAIALIAKSIPKVKLYILGDGPEMNRLKKLAIAQNVDTRVIFMGQVENFTKVIKLLKSSHLFCLPSAVEGFGLATIEAMASGIPYVNLNIPATHEITQGGRGGILVDQLDSTRFANELEQLLKNPRLYNTKVREGQNLVKKYDWSECVVKTEKAFQKIIRQAKT